MGKIMAKLQWLIESMEKRKMMKMKKSKWEKAAEKARLEEKNDNETKAKG